MGLFKGEVPVFARLWPIGVMVGVRFTTEAVRSDILATAGLLVVVVSMCRRCIAKPVCTCACRCRRRCL